MQGEMNILMALSDDYGRRMINEVFKRTKVLLKEISAMFIDLLVLNQKILNILGIMMTDRLFFEYMYGVYRKNYNK